MERIDRPPSADDQARTSERLETLSGIIYGCIIYLAVLAVVSEEDPPPTDGETASVLCATAFVYWAAHVYAHIVPRLVAGRRLSFGRAMANDLPILAAVLVPLVPVVLHAMGILADRSVFDLAWGATLVVLFLAVYDLGRRAGRSWIAALAAGGAAIVAALLIVTLKAALH